MDTVQFCRHVQDCMMTRDYIAMHCRMLAKVKRSIPVKKVETRSLESTIVPAKDFRGLSKPVDTLFWCMLYLFDKDLYMKEIPHATFQREQELKYAMMSRLDHVDEKRIRTHGYGNKRICKSKGLEPHLTVKEVLGELSGSKVMTLPGISAWLAYTGVSNPMFAVMKYDVHTLAIPFGTTKTALYQYKYVPEHGHIMVLTRERYSWALTQVNELDADIFSGLSACLRPMSVYSAEEVKSMCELMNVPVSKTKKANYEQVQQWIHYRVCLLRKGFTLVHSN